MNKDNINKMNVDGWCEEIIWYFPKNDNGEYQIPIALDFDYTCTKKSSWLEGTWEENPHCFETLKKWQNMGCVFILNTFRNAEFAKKPVEWLESNGIHVYGVGKHPIQKIEDGESNKIWSIFNIDDMNVGTFLVCNKNERPYVDWELMDMYLTPIIEKMRNRIPQIEKDILEIKKKCASAHQE